MHARLFYFLCFLMGMTSCTQPRVKRYSNILEPMVGTGKKEEVGKILGPPVKCTQEQAFDKCEYRTARERNYPVPIVHEQKPAMGPDVSPYEYFDVLHLYYDGFGILREWEPIVIHQTSTH